MRFLIALALLASCAPAEPAVEIAGGEPHLAEMRYSCSDGGYEVVRWTFADGGYEESLTGSRCDPATYEVRQSRRSEHMMTFEEWQRRNRPEA